MTYSNQKRLVGATLALLPFIVLFAIGLYNSVNSDIKPFETPGNVNHQRNLIYPPHSGIPADEILKTQVLLQRGAKVVIDKTCLVFKGVSRGKVALDLYLLEMDPDVSYPLSFTKESLQKGVWVDNVMYQLVSVRKKSLRLMIQDIY